MKNTNYYIIGHGLSGGFVCTQSYEVIKASSTEEVEARQQVRETYGSYTRFRSLRDISKVVEQEQKDM